MTDETKRQLDSDLAELTTEEHEYLFAKMLKNNTTCVCDSCIANGVPKYKVFVGDYVDEPCSYCGEMLGAREAIEV